MIADCPWLPPSMAPNMLLALLWASQANSVPATFWAYAHLLLPGHGDLCTAVRHELKDGSDDDIIAVSEASCSCPAVIVWRWDLADLGRHSSAGIAIVLRSKSLHVCASHSGTANQADIAEHARAYETVMSSPR